MDEVNDFFDFSKEYKRKYVYANYSTPTVSENALEDKIVKREEEGDEYAKRYVEEEQKQMREAFSKVNSTRDASSTKMSVCSEMTGYDDDDDGDDDDDYDDDDDENMDKESDKITKHKASLELYSKFNFKNHDPASAVLPIAENKMKILKAIRDNPVVVLQGDTGSGKTTQVPQYILDDARQRQEYCNIVCTQPRRIAAISIAERVCAERDWKIGSIVGYQVSLHAHISNDTRLLYCTTGVLLQSLIKQKNMSIYTHIILDEVHERDQEMDFLLIVVRRLLIRSPHVKVILMSATIDATAFSEYFKIPVGITFVPAPIVKCDNRKLYQVKVYYLEELSQLISSPDIINYEEPGISDAMYKMACKLIVVCKESNYNDKDDVKSSSILVFLPGINEIDRMYTEIQKFSECPGVKVVCIKLHSMITSDEQRAAFLPSPPNTVKVILATNIAESSITVPDVRNVIDFCLTKYLIADSNTNLTTLQLNWASRANCQQRAGRAGRLRSGKVYRLVSKEFYSNHMLEFSTPEMTRCPLANVVLKAKLLDLDREPAAVLGLAMDPPNLSDIHNTILHLKEAGALFKTVDGEYSEFDGGLTYIGYVMAHLPLDIQVTRLIILGYIYGVLDETIIIAAGLTVKSIFAYPSGTLHESKEKGMESLKAYVQKLTWADGSGSDLIAILRAYNVWDSFKQHKSFDTYEEELQWARRYYLNIKSMREMHLLIDELRKRLKVAGIDSSYGHNKIHWSSLEKAIILKIVIAGAFYPHYFLRISNQNTLNERDIYNSLNGRDPHDTVYLQGFDPRSIGELYVDQIKEMFTSTYQGMDAETIKILKRNIEVHFDKNSSKIFITFKDEMGKDNENDYKITMPGLIRMEVFKAVKMRQLKFNTTIKCMMFNREIHFATKFGLGSMENGKWVPKKKQFKNLELVAIPSLFTEVLQGRITHIENCGKFWFLSHEEEKRVKEIIHNLNGPSSDIAPFKDLTEIKRDMIVAAPYIESGRITKYYRAKIVSLRDMTNIIFNVLFIDVGKLAFVTFDKLRKLGKATEQLKDIPERIFQCSLCGITPSSVRCPKSEWDKNANDKMKELVDGVDNVEIEIYSVVHKVAKVILKAKDGTVVNDVLVNQGYAQNTEENYLSKQDHDLRVRKQSVSGTMHQRDKTIENEAYLRSIVCDEEYCTAPAPRYDCSKSVVLKGPYSPLETTLYSGMRIGSWKPISVEPESVNSVLLDIDSQNHDRLIVSAGISETNNGRIIARQTTLMPNIPGFAPLVAAIFCPQMQLRLNSNRTRFISILTGLGADQNGRPLYEEHDLLLHLDVELTIKDIENINRLRYFMDTLIHTEVDQDIPRVEHNKKVELQKQIKQLIQELMSRPRASVEKNRVPGEFSWLKSGNEYDFIEPLEDVYANRAIFPFHKIPQLHMESFKALEELRVHCDELHKISLFGYAVKITCKLCDQYLESNSQLRIHLLTKLHIDREYQIGYKRKNKI